MTAPAPRPPRPRWLAPALATTALVALLGSLPSLLDGSDPLPDRADAIHVFPGDVPARPLCAVELWRRGIAPRVVFTGGSPDRTLSALGDRASDAEVASRIARRAGLPEEASVILPEGTSTWEDAQALAAFVRASGLRSIVAVTSPIHARRARRSLGIALRDTGARFAVLACGPRLAGTAWWWQERSLVAVVVETAKSLLYEVRHFLPDRLGMG